MSNKYSLLLLHITRYLVGVLFIFSGLIKANDPLGLAYKIEEFFQTFSLNLGSGYITYLAVIIIALEIILGVALLLSYKMKITLPIYLGIIIVFLFITTYALITGNLKYCGCFGDCIPLSPLTSSLKDIILLAIGIWLYIYRNYLYTIKESKHKLFIKHAIIVTSLFLILGFQFYILKHLPIIDCLPYKKNIHLYSLLIQTSKVESNNTIIYFTYKDKSGKKITFDANHFPENFNPDELEFISRQDIKIRKPLTYVNISDFNLMNEEGTDITFSIINNKNNAIIVCIQDVENLPLDFYTEIQRIKKIGIKQHHAEMYLLTNNISNLKEHLLKNNLKIEEWNFITADNTLLHTFARSNPTIYFILNGFIKNKWGAYSLNSITL